MTRYVAYLRVSTTRQGRSGLGVASQRSLIERFVASTDQVIAEFVEVQSGKNDAREQLWRAIAHAKKHDAKILIAKLDRFSRKVSFITGIMEQGIGLVVAEMPHATDFQLHIFAALAQEERRLISQRTHLALQEAKRRGVKLGQNAKVLSARNHTGAIDYAKGLEPLIRPLLDEGQSLCQIARQLNESGVPSARGGRFFPETVKNIVRHMAQ